MNLWPKRAAGLFQVAIISVGSAVYSISQWAILILFARATSPADMGAYSYALSVSAPFFIFFTLSLRQIYISDSDKNGAWSKYLFLRIVATIIGITIACLFASLSGKLTDIYMLVSLIKAADLIGDIWLAPAQAGGKSRSLGIYHIINGTSSLALFAGGLAVGMAPASALAMSLVGSIIAACYALHVGRTSLPKIGPPLRASGGSLRRSTFKLAVVAAPLGFAGFLNSATQAAPGYFLERSEGLTSVGIYSAMVYLLLAGNTVVSAMVQYELPRTVAEYQTRGRASTHRRVKRLSAVMAFFGAIGVGFILLWGEPIMDLLYGPGYGLHSTLVLLGFSWAVGAVSWIWDMALVVERAFMFQMVAAATGVVVAVIASITLVEPLGLLGAGLVTLLAQIAVAVVRLLGLFLLSLRSRSGVKD